MKLYEFKEITKCLIISSSIIAAYFFIFTFGMAWLNHEYNVEELANVPRLQSSVDYLNGKFNAYDANFNKIMPSCLKGYSTSNGNKNQR